jgi:hypothetical protein
VDMNGPSQGHSGGRCAICLGTRFQDVELTCYELNGERQCVCDSCARLREFGPAIDHCDVCKARCRPEDLHDTSCGDESMRVCSACLTCSVCGRMVEFDDLWPPDACVGLRSQVCMDCAVCRQCGEPDEPMNMTHYVLNGKTVFVCAECERCIGCGEDAKPLDFYPCKDVALLLCARCARGCGLLAPRKRNSVKS